MDHETYFREKYPDYQVLIDEQVQLIETKEAVLEINGDEVMKAFRIPPSKLVGDILTYIRTICPDAQVVSNEVRALVLKEFDLLEAS